MAPSTVASSSPDTPPAPNVPLAVLAQFESLARTGKPQPHEHTVLAGIALTLPAPHPHPAPPALTTVAAAAAAAPSTTIPVSPVEAGPPKQQAQLQQQPQPGPLPRAWGTPLVIALATGTKCLPASKRDPGGRALNDCHAEVATRRALLRWLYCEGMEAVQVYRQGRGDGTPVLRVVQRQGQGQQGQGQGQQGREQQGREQGQQERGQPGRSRWDSPLAAATSPVEGKGQLGDSGGDAIALPPWLHQLLLPDGWQLELRPGVELHMYISQPPCGDASIIEGLAADGQPDCGACGSGSRIVARQRHAVQVAQQAWGQPAAAGGEEGQAARLQVLGRTGAKPLKRPRLDQDGPAEPALQQQQLQGERHSAGAGEGLAASTAGAAWAIPQAHDVESYSEAQAVGVARRKPGRGEATLSMSCSDKLARWHLLGLQGSLLSGLLAAPLHLASLTVTMPLPAAGPDSWSEAPAGGAAAHPAAAAPAGHTAGPEASGAVPAAAQTATPEALAAAVDASLRRALVDRASPLLNVLPEPFCSSAAAPLCLRVHCPQGASERARLEDLGLAPGGPRKVAGGSTLVWHAPPSTQFLDKGGLKAAFIAMSPAGPEGSQGQQVYVVKGGSQEAVAGSTGVKLGHARKGAAPVPPAAAPSICKASLLGLFWGLAGELASLDLQPPPLLPPPGEQPRQQVAGQALVAAGPSKALDAARLGAMPATAVAAGGEAGGELAAASSMGTAAESHVPRAGGCSYRRTKHGVGAGYQAAWRWLLEVLGGALEGWIPKPADLENFVLTT